MSNEINIMTASAKSLNLVDNGIFPITRNEIGEMIDNSIDTGLDVPGTIQGEGKLLGTPCLFIRTSTCNLNCSWLGSDGNGSLCDTPYSSHFPENNRVSIDKILAIVGHNIGKLNHIVVSGGEPLLQGRRLYDLLIELKLKHQVKITIETNGTIYIPEIASIVDLISISPKLSSSTPWAGNLKNTGINFNEKIAKSHERKRINFQSLQRWIDVKKNYSNQGKDFQLKFVVSTPKDIEEIKFILDQLNNWTPDDICLMPEGVTPEDLMNKTNWLVKLCIENGFRFTPRLHALIWGVQRHV